MGALRGRFGGSLPGEGPRGEGSSAGMSLAEAARRLRPARRWLVITGAGMSAESGLPTYRGVGGLYEGVDPEEGLALTVLTQNVDGFHLAAGSRNMVAIHGDCHDLRCDACGERWRVPDYAGLEIPPRCRACGESARPDVALFGEMLPSRGVARLRGLLAEGVDAVRSVGTSSLFPYIAGPVMLAAAQGLPTLEVNPGESAVSGVVGLRLRCEAGGALEALEEALAS